MAASLAVLLLQAVALKELHYLFDHHHDEVAHCSTNGTEKHIHSEDYAHIDCFLCTLHFSPATFDFQGFTIKLFTVPSAKVSFAYKPILTTQANWHTLLRGPPSLAV